MRIHQFGFAPTTDMFICSHVKFNATSIIDNELNWTKFPDRSSIQKPARHRALGHLIKHRYPPYSQQGIRVLKLRRVTHLWGSLTA